MLGVQVSIHQIGAVICRRKPQTQMQGTHKIHTLIMLLSLGCKSSAVVKWPIACSTCPNFLQTLPIKKCTLDSRGALLRTAYGHKEGEQM